MKWVLLLILFVTSACVIVEEPTPELVPSEEGSVEVFFCPKDDCETGLINYLQGAIDVKCAFFDLELQGLINSLSAYEENILIDDEQHEGFGTKVRNPSGLMHHKFCVFEKDNLKFVSTGSFNPTNNGANKNHNNLIIIQSEKLHENYLEEWEELNNGETTSRSAPVTYPRVLVNNELFENYFCPEDKCEEKLLAVLDFADTSIKFMVFSFTSDPVGDLLVSKHESGVFIEGIFEKQQNSQYSEYSKLNEAGASVIVDKQSGKVHHKVFIIDDEILVTGSYNPSASGTKRNNENMLIIHDKEIVKWYLDEYNKIMEENR